MTENQELEEMRHQIAILHKKLDAQVIVNSRLMKNVLTHRINIINRQTFGSYASAQCPIIIFPIISAVTMLVSYWLTNKLSGQQSQMQGSMKLTMYMMPLMYVFFCFTVPCAFSLYYVISNIVMTIQTQVMRKIYDPEKMKEQVKAEIASRKKEEKRGVKSTTIKVQDEKTGEVVEKNISASEMNKRRLEYARQQDAERYKDERTVPLSELQNKKED